VLFHCSFHLRSGSFQHRAPTWWIKQSHHSTRSTTFLETFFSTFVVRHFPVSQFQQTSPRGTPEILVLLNNAVPKMPVAGVSLPTVIMYGRERTASFVDGECTAAGDLKETGQRLLTAHAPRDDTHCSTVISTEHLANWWPICHLPSTRNENKNNFRWSYFKHAHLHGTGTLYASEHFPMNTA